VLTFPVWVLILAAVVIERPRRVDGFDMAQQKMAMQSLELALNVPVAGWRKCAYDLVIAWIRRESLAIDTLVGLGVTSVEA
jgi:hypothetical protein